MAFYKETHLPQRTYRYRLMARTPYFGILVCLGKYGRGLRIRIRGYQKRKRRGNIWFDGIMNFGQLDQLITELTRQLRGTVDNYENYRPVGTGHEFTIEVLGQPYGDGHYNLAIAVKGAHLYLFGLQNRSLRTFLWNLRRERGFAVKEHNTHLHLVHSEITAISPLPVLLFAPARHP